MIVGQDGSAFIDGSAQDCVGQGVTGGVYVPSAVDKRMGMLCCYNGVQHDAHMSAGGIFHTGRHVKTADSHAVVLIFHRACAYGHIGEKICKIPPVFRIEHLVRGGQAGLLDVADMELADGDQAL